MPNNIEAGPREFQETPEEKKEREQEELVNKYKGELKEFVSVQKAWEASNPELAKEQRKELGKDPNAEEAPGETDQRILEHYRMVTQKTIEGLKKEREGAFKKFSELAEKAQFPLPGEIEEWDRMQTAEEVTSFWKPVNETARTASTKKERDRAAKLGSDGLVMRLNVHELASKIEDWDLRDTAVNELLNEMSTEKELRRLEQK